MLVWGSVGNGGDDQDALADNGLDVISAGRFFSCPTTRFSNVSGHAQAPTVVLQVLQGPRRRLPNLLPPCRAEVCRAAYPADASNVHSTEFSSPAFRSRDTCGTLQIAHDLTRPSPRPVNSFVPIPGRH